MKSSRDGGGALEKEKWVLCPICNNNALIKVRPNTVLKNFLLFCPKCKWETVISVTGQIYRKSPSVQQKNQI